MKKLMVIAALMCAAVSAQADTCEWNFIASNVPNRPDKQSQASYYSGECSYLCNGTQFSNTTYPPTLSNGSGGYHDYVCDQAGTYTFTLSINDGDYTYTESVSAVVSEVWHYPEEWEFGDPYSELEHEENVYFTGAGSWTGGSSNAPEPTSGLLLLIGMAGLALKRKRA